MKKLTKTILWALVGMGMGYIITMGDSSMRVVMMLGMAGLPAGWSAVGELQVVAFSIVGILIRVILSVFVGWVALPLEIIKGISCVVKERQEM